VRATLGYTERRGLTLPAELKKGGQLGLTHDEDGGRHGREEPRRSLINRNLGTGSETKPA